MSVPTSGRPSDTVLGWYDTTRRSLDPWVRAWASAADDALSASATLGGLASQYVSPASAWFSPPAPGWGAPAPAAWGSPAPTTTSPWDWWPRPSDPTRSHGHDCQCGGHDREPGGHDCGCGGRERHRGNRECGERDRCGDPCRARVVDADLVVTARPNERRVVPIELRNTWHRDRTLAVALGPFIADQCGPDPRWVVSGTVTPSGEVTLEPCSHTTLEVVLEIGPVVEAGKGKTVAAAARPHQATTFYADLSLAGCGRAQRLAVVVLPERCGAHHVAPSACCCE